MLEHGLLLLYLYLSFTRVMMVIIQGWVGLQKNTLHHILNTFTSKQADRVKSHEDQMAQ